MSERAYKQVAEQKAKQILQQLRDRDLKERIEFKQDLIEQGKVDALPSEVSLQELKKQEESMSSRTRHVEMSVDGKEVSFEIFYMSEFSTNGGWWFDVEITAKKMKSTHRIIVGNDFTTTLGAQSPQEVVQKAFALLISKNVARKTEGIITSEIFPVNYFTVTNLVAQFPDFLELFGKSSDSFDFDRSQWNFKQVHDYSQDNKRTIPAGPMGGFFDPAAVR
eukprot:gb/GFBE01027193.1/.p1 GENE.gb/GFBE01027193.1/~~gb/GFBE01027193.1/.p1  ORF type:complete len:221 (+),score=63.30 gb/GFBE01027193.1/:1-663(+)